METIDYSGKVLKCKGECPACAYNKHEFSLPCGIAYEDDICVVSQDWQLPIVGMFIVAPKKHIVLFEEMTSAERTHIFEIVNQVISILRKNNISKNFNVIFEEKKDIHFHIWILPRDGWKDKGIDPTKDIKHLMEYALTNNKNNNTYSEIKRVSNLLKNEMKNK